MPRGVGTLYAVSDVPTADETGIELGPSPAAAWDVPAGSSRLRTTPCWVSASRSTSSAPNLGSGRTLLAAEVAARLLRPQLHVTVDNEANLAALGELWEGRGREWGDFIHISGEIGVGAGVVIGGELLRGSAGIQRRVRSRPGRPE